MNFVLIIFAHNYNNICQDNNIISDDELEEDEQRIQNEEGRYDDNMEIDTPYTRHHIVLRCMNI